MTDQTLQEAEAQWLRNQKEPVEAERYPQAVNFKAMISAMRKGMEG